MTIEIMKINSGRLRAINTAATLQYSEAGEEIWRRLSGSGVALSIYRDNIEEEFTVKKVSGITSDGKKQVDDLFGQKYWRC